MSTPPRDLPIQPSNFIGRESAIAEVKRLLTISRIYELVKMRMAESGVAIL